MQKIQNVWLTINRNCNLRCQWCYAKGKEFDYNLNMDINLAKNIVDFFKELGVEEIALIGGEPTCYNDLENLIKYIKKKNMNVCLITNGILFSDKQYLSKLEKLGVDDINFSIKGWSRKSYKENTGMDSYNQMLQALKNLSESKINTLASFVISSYNCEKISDVIETVANCGIDNFFFSFENDFSVLDGIEKKYDVKKIIKVVKTFENQYNKIDELTKGNFTIHQSLPLCAWDEKIIKKMVERNQILTSCMLLQRNGLVFDTDGSLIPCNSIHQFKLGTFNKDFNDANTFYKYWESDYIIKIYDKLCALPDNICSKCKDNNVCGGGCLSNWYNYKFNDLLSANVISLNTKIDKN